MTTVDPIRNKEDIRKMKDVLLKKCYRDYLIFEVGINTGLRISDILNLKVSDVRDKYYIEIRERKTKKSKKFRINEFLRKEVEEYISSKQDEDYIFDSFRTPGKILDRIRIYRILNAAAWNAGLKIRIGTHTMRKTFGFHFYQKTKDIAMLQQIFNHSSPSITLRYIGINQDIMDNAMADFVL